jgi:protein-S-isoprenylcysteine O-methyltransferase
MAVYAPAAFVGCGFGSGLAVVALSPGHYSWGLYVTALSFFHFSEYIMTSLYNADTVNFDSFLLNHSRPYAIAAVASWTEYWLEAALLPSMVSPTVSQIGLAMVVVGETIRKLAMYTAASNFTHIVADEHKEGHQLVTHGVYQLSRHPAYMGWFWWSVGTQVVLCNPICTVAYAAATYKFFSARVKIEEFYLLRFFGKKYLDYQKNVGTGIPFVSGLTGLTEAEVKLYSEQNDSSDL